MVFSALSSDHGRTRAMRRTSGIPKCAPHLLQSGSRKHFSAYLSYEDQAGTRRKIESGDRRGNRVGTREERTAPACAWSDVLHDVEATVSERRRQELTSTRDVSCCG